jgi:hypothetical protein
MGGNVVDYLEEQRASFADVPLGDVDSLVLATVAYFRFENGTLEHTLAAFGVRFKIWYLDRFEYERIQEIDHCMDWKFNQKDYMTCILFDYPDTVREQVKFIIQMMSVYWGSFWGYSDVLMYKFDGNIYLPMEDRTSELVAAAHDIAGLAFWLTHSDAKRSFQYEGEELKKLKHKICAMLPDNSSYGYQQVSKIID